MGSKLPNRQKQEKALTIEYSVPKDPIADIKISWEQIRKYRMGKGLTQKQFGKMMGVDKITVFGWEKEKYTPNKKHKEKLLHFINPNQ